MQPSLFKDSLDVFRQHTVVDRLQGPGYQKIASWSILIQQIIKRKESMGSHFKITSNVACPFLMIAKLNMRIQVGADNRLYVDDVAIRKKVRNSSKIFVGCFYRKGYLPSSSGRKLSHKAFSVESVPMKLQCFLLQLGDFHG